MIRLAPLLLLVGCYVGPHPGDSLRPIGPDGWAEAVQDAADVWSIALGPECPRFEVADDGDWPVVLLSEREWPYADNVLGLYTPGYGIEIQGNAPTNKRTILLHELGHGVLGLGHDPDRDSIMYYAPRVAWPSDDDIATARERWGC